MTNLGWSLLAAGSLATVFLFAKERKASPDFFPGAASEIPSDAANRAELAVAKWTAPATWEDEDPTEAPYFWDFEKVGRHVFLRVLKGSNFSGIVEVWLENPEDGKYERFKSYRIAFYSGCPGPKEKEGDMQAPEGFYAVTRGRMNPTSDYHLSMDIGYPNAFDRFHGRTGSYLMIHGKAVSVGCFAMTDASIEQIYTLVDAAMSAGQRTVAVHCFPFAMTDEAMEENAESEHIEFWRNLKEGWDWFETHRRPPEVGVKEGRYVFPGSP